MKIIVATTLVSGLFLSNLFAQVSTSQKESFQSAKPFVFSINEDKVYADEFKRQFLKNINPKEDPISQADISNYLDLYIKFKLKVKDSKDAGLDTATAYVQELQMYRDQLARNYLYDRAVTETLIKEAYDRMKFELRVSHILVLQAPDAPESDQKKALEKIEAIQRMLAKQPSAENFGEIARTESEDVGTKNNGGDLGYLTALQVVYEFENQAYKTPMGEFSEVFKTDFGYHILFVTDKRLNRGNIKVNHILIRVMNKDENTDSEAKKKIDEIAASISSGKETFDNMARTNSEDYNSRYNGGQMDYMNVTQFVGDLDRQYWISQAFGLKKDGEMTVPFRTNYGWHLLQRVAVKPIGSFEDNELKALLKTEVQKNQRSQISIDSLVGKIKKQNKFILNPTTIDIVLSYLDSNFMKGKFDETRMPELHTLAIGSGEKATKTQFNLRKMEVFNLGGEEFSVADLFIQLSYNTKPITGSKKEGLSKIVDAWINQSCVEYQNLHLEEKSLEFKDIYQEYKEGILMFNRMQELVWDRANRDSVGLEKYFVEHQSAYVWGNRFDVEVYFCNDAKMMKSVAKGIKKGLSADSLRRQYTKKNILDFSSRMGKYEISDTFLFAPSKVLNILFEDASSPNSKYKKPGIYSMGQVADDFVVLKVKRFSAPSPKLLDETRGPLASKYQEQLEKQWIESLKNRYTIYIDKSVLQSLQDELVNTK
ncbi:MAG: hypothetical protein EXR17_06080 [Flavobacteriaceae bacterium]|nr:hypothetical protein [Flavobacteriaceae bacterium]